MFSTKLVPLEEYNEFHNNTLSFSNLRSISKNFNLSINKFEFSKEKKKLRNVTEFHNYRLKKKTKDPSQNRKNAEAIS